jgi:hypothetical protein
LPVFDIHSTQPPAGSVRVWWALAAVAFALGAYFLTQGSVPVLAGLICVVCTTCALSVSHRRWVQDWLVWSFSGSAIRSSLIIGGALALIHFIPLELAVLLMGDVIVYVELLVAVSLIRSANIISHVSETVRGRVSTVRSSIPTVRGRAPRRRRPARAKSVPSKDDPAPGFDWGAMTLRAMHRVETRLALG